MGQRIEITGDLDRKAVEALQLEIRRLIQRFGMSVTELRIERISAEEEDSST